MSNLTPKIQKRLAKNIIALRRHRGWSQEECAHRIDIAPAYLSRIERGIVNVTLKNLVKLANGFKIDISQLVKPNNN